MGMVYIRCNEDGTYKSSVDKFYDQKDLKNIADKANAKKTMKSAGVPVVPGGEEVLTSSEEAKEIAKKSPLAVWGSKEAINYTRGRTIEEGLNQIAMWQTGMYNPQVDMKEALSAQIEKKDPEFEDLYPIKKDLGLL